MPVFDIASQNFTYFVHVLQRYYLQNYTDFQWRSICGRYEKQTHYKADMWMFNLLQHIVL